MSEDHEQQLEGGITNAGSVVRVGDHVLRPSSQHTASVHAYLRAINEAGFDGAPVPIGIEPDGRERLTFIEGQVPLSPYPEWSQSNEALASIARLVRRLHEAARDFAHEGLEWNRTLADPVVGTMMCHNDLELSNIVFRNGVAVGFIDFEFVAPGRAIYDLAQFARLCVPFEHEFDKARMDWKPAAGPARLRLVADEYGLDQAGRAQLLGAIDDAMAVIERVVRRSVQQDGAAAAAFDEQGGLAKYDRRREWCARHREAFSAALR